MSNLKLADIVEEIQFSLQVMGDQGIRGLDLSATSLDLLAGWSNKPAVRADDLETVRGDICGCSRCALAGSRVQAVTGDGNPAARLIFVGDGPNEDEERAGKPLEGQEGQLLAKIIRAMGLSPDEVFICHLLKCRPPASRRPDADEIQTCLPFVKRQIDLIKPDFICALGQTVAQTLLNADQPIARLRGRFHDFMGIPVMPTFHPAYLLRNPPRKREVWEDMKTLMRAMDLPEPSGG